MKLVNHRYETREKLEHFLAQFKESVQTVFIQFFSGNMQKEDIQNVLNCVVAMLPNAVLIGATTAGEILDGAITSNEMILSVSLFDSTKVKTYYYPNSNFTYGSIAANEIITPLTKACVLFSEGLKSDSESFLEGFTSVCNDVVLAGGNAGDDLTFTRTYVFKDNVIYDDGIVIAVLDGEHLHVNPTYSLNWTVIGKSMQITNADKNIIYQIDNKNVRDIYTHYLGKETVAQIPASAIEFPLIKVEEDVDIARSLIGQTEDGGFIYAGHFKNGDRVKFAIGNIQNILDRAVEMRNNVASKPAEATYIYSCSVRKLFLNEQLNYEFGLINELSPTAGFFTYGEFFHSTMKSNKLLNITTTVLTLSESTEQHHENKNVKVLAYKHSMLKSLTHLVNTTQNELNDTIKMLDQYKMVFDQSSIVSKTDEKGCIIYVNDAFCKASEYTKEELIGKSHSLVRHPEVNSALFRHLWETILSGKIWKETFKNRSKSGREYYTKTVIAPIYDDSGNIVEFIASQTDVTELILKDQIIQSQLFDQLTGLKNRTALFDKFTQSTQEIILLLFNIDRFSAINDYFGYEAGDKLLKMFAQRLNESKETAYVYRINSDEFALICVDVKENIKDLAANFISNIENFKYTIVENDLSITVSAGVATALHNEVYHLAHMALKEAKERHKKLVIYNDNIALTEKTHKNIFMFNKIKNAIDEERIVPFFQGIVDNNTSKIVKYESLMRLIDKDGTVVPPNNFIEHAKKAILYNQLTKIMVQKTLKLFEKSDYDFSINLNILDIQSKETMSFIYNQLEQSKNSSHAIFEIVESKEIENYEEVLEFIKRVKQFGCKIAIDDFGSGYSNFYYLSRLDVDYIKIDGSLIKKINQDNDNRSIVESILYFARKKGIKTIAEYVEDEAIFRTVQELGIDYSQGYYFSVPSSNILCEN